MDPFPFFNVPCHSLMTRPFEVPLICVTWYTAPLPFFPFLLDSIRNTAIPQIPVYILTSVFPRLLSFFSSRFFYASTRHLPSKLSLVAPRTSLVVYYPRAIYQLLARNLCPLSHHYRLVFAVDRLSTHSFLILVVDRLSTYSSLVPVVDSLSTPSSQALVVDRLSTPSSLVLVVDRLLTSQSPFEILRT